jgi:hypothetical protein
MSDIKEIIEFNPAETIFDSEEICHLLNIDADELHRLTRSGILQSNGFCPNFSGGGRNFPNTYDVLFAFSYRLLLERDFTPKAAFSISDHLTRHLSESIEIREATSGEPFTASARLLLYDFFYTYREDRAGRLSCFLTLQEVVDQTMAFFVDIEAYSQRPPAVPLP